MQAILNLIRHSIGNQCNAEDLDVVGQRYCGPGDVDWSETGVGTRTLMRTEDDGVRFVGI